MTRFAYLAVAAALGLGVSNASAQDSVGDMFAASTASVNLGGDLAASGVRTVAAASVLPASTAALGSGVAGSVAGGVVGGALTTGANGMMRVTGDLAKFATGPLPVTREIVVAPQPMPHVPYAAAPDGPAH